MPIVMHHSHCVVCTVTVTTLHMSVTGARSQSLCTVTVTVCTVWCADEQLPCGVQVVAAQVSAGLTCQAAAYDAARVLQFLTVTEDATARAIHAEVGLSAGPKSCDITHAATPHSFPACVRRDPSIFRPRMPAGSARWLAFCVLAARACCTRSPVAAS